jgi:hypothetical protein
MTNSVYTMIARALSLSVSERAADTMLRSALRERGLSPETVTAQEMQGVLSGPLMDRLGAALPHARARTELLSLSRRLEREDPKAPTLFTDVGAFATWDDVSMSPASALHDAPELGADDFEFDDPDFSAAPQRPTFELGTAAGQEALIQHLGKFQGVQGVLVSRPNGELLRARALRDARALSSVMAAASLVFRRRGLHLMSADLGGQTVCMRPMGEYCVAVVAGPQVNIGRLLSELQGLELQGQPGAPRGHIQGESA